MAHTRSAPSSPCERRGRDLETACPESAVPSTRGKAGEQVPHVPQRPCLRCQSNMLPFYARIVAKRYLGPSNVHVFISLVTTVVLVARRLHQRVDHLDIAIQGRSVLFVRMGRQNGSEDYAIGVEVSSGRSIDEPTATPCDRCTRDYRAASVISKL